MKLVCDWMLSNPEKVIEKEKVRLEMLRSADDLKHECKETWKNKLPLERENLPAIKTTLESLEGKLLDLQNKVEKLDLVSTPLSIDERIEYTNSLVSIVRKYKEKIEKCEKEPADYDTLHTQNDIYLADIFSLTAGGNDLAYGTFLAEKVKHKETNLEEINKVALEDVNSYHKYLAEEKRIPDKSPQNVAKLTWSTLWIMNPIESVKDENELYVILLNGNFNSWKKIYRRKQLTIDYIRNFRKNWWKMWGEDLGKKLNKYYRGWWSFLCYPDLLTCVSTPEVQIRLDEINKIAEKERKIPYIS